MNRPTILAVLSLYVAFILFLTLGDAFGPGATGRGGSSFIPFWAIARGVWRGGQEFWINVVGNIVVFMPIGAGVLGVSPTSGRLWQAALAGFALSLLIETLQYVSGRRVADVDDLTLNTLGAALGFLAADIIRRRAVRRRGTNQVEPRAVRR